MRQAPSKATRRGVVQKMGEGAGPSFGSLSNKYLVLVTALGAENCALPGLVASEPPILGPWYPKESPS